MPRIDDDTLITPALLRRFGAEAGMEGGNGQYCAFIERTNGDLNIHHPFGLPCVAEQTMFAADVLRRLNRELHHDGAWVIVFTDPKPLDADQVLYSNPHTEYARYVILWVDQDGDVQVPIEWVRGETELLTFDEVLLAGIESIMQCCEGAWSMWKVAMKDVIDPAEGQTYKRAMGQLPGSATRH